MYLRFDVTYCNIYTGVSMSVLHQLVKRCCVRFNEYPRPSRLLSEEQSVGELDAIQRSHLQVSAFVSRVKESLIRIQIFVILSVPLAGSRRVRLSTQNGSRSLGMRASRQPDTESDVYPMSCMNRRKDSCRETLFVSLTLQSRHSKQHLN